MAKRRKAGVKAGTRRTTRRGKQAEGNNSLNEGASSTTSEPSSDLQSNAGLPIDATIPLSDVTDLQPEPAKDNSGHALCPTNIQPVVALHKKFGKYRCLFNNDDVFSRKYENCSDSETNSSVDIKVQDLCCGSESDSNTAVESRCEVSLHTNPESKHSLNENSQASNKEFNTLNESEILKDTHNYNEKLEEETNSDQVNKNENQIQNTSHDQVTESTMDLNNYEDDEVITIVQIVEDDNQDMYYDINIENANESNMHSEKSIEQDEMKKQNDIGKDFAKLNLLQDDSSPYSPTDRLMFDICNTEVQTLSRPDPCLTPSSTLSDDSNSSRATELIQAYSNDSSESSPTGVRRSSRIKTISNLKQKTKGYGLVKTPLKKALITQTKLKLEEISENQDKSSDGLLNNPPCLSPFPIPSEMPVKVKSRWRRSSELEMGTNSPAISPLASPSLPQKLPVLDENPPVEEEIPSEPLSKEAHDKIIEERMSQFQHLEENEYLCERMISKETKKMICDCFMTKEELERGELACGEDCLNRLLMIECNSRCPVGDRCTNRRFQKKQLGPLRVFYADKKGCGVEASGDISAGEFLMEYVGEVLDSEQFYKRAQAYSDENNLHHYFMSLKGDTVIDATLKGNISRFINHSCEPNAETQKWTVNGELRIGFFSKRDIPAGEEITFDYQFQRFGKEAQRCYCGAENCRGWIGAEPDSEDEEDEEDVSTSKLDATLSSEHDATSENAAAPRQITVKAKRERKYKSKKPELGLDADMEEELEALARTGVKNQSHTLRLSRTVVRARARRSQVALLRMLRDADLPCRRLFLDYRGLRLLAPWCSDAPLDFRYEMLLTVDRLPIPNKTMVHESRFFTIVEKWLSSSDIQTSEPVFIDEATGLPLELPNSEVIAEKAKENSTILQKVKDLSGQLLERWSNLKEVFKIPKKERIQQMKEHERQANVERRAADSSGSRDRDRDRDRREERDRDRDRDRRDERDRDRERERDRDRDRERERDRKRERERDRDRDRDDRDRRKRRSSPEGRRSIRLNERVLAAVPPMSKEERRRAFAEAAEAAEAARRAPAPPGPATPMPHPQHGWPPFWPQDFSQMFPQGMMGNAPNMMNGPNMMGGPQNMLGPMSGPMSNMPGMMSMPSEVPPEWIGPNGEYQGPPGFCPPFNGPQTFCMPQPNMMGMSSFGMGGFMFGQQMGPGFSAPPAPVTAPAPATATAPLPTSAPASAADVQMQEASAEVVLPSMWRSAVDERGRRYFYHVKLRQPQWEPPPPPPDESESEEEAEALSALDTAIIQRKVKGKLVEGVNGIYEVIKEDPLNGLIPDHALVNLKPRKRRPGLVTERPISPRTEEDKLAGRLEVKRYKQTKEKLRRRREKLLQRARRLAPQHLKFADLVDTDSASSGSEEAVSPDADEARRIKEQFRSGMARVMVQHLNPYRRADAPVARITSTADFKHLARKLTHFVMLKELKHCRSVEELVVTDSVRSKAKMFVKKYMMKFGPVYKPPPDEAD